MTKYLVRLTKVDLGFIEWQSKFSNYSSPLVANPRKGQMRVVEAVGEGTTTFYLHSKHCEPVLMHVTEAEFDIVREL